MNNLSTRPNRSRQSVVRPLIAAQFLCPQFLYPRWFTIAWLLLIAAAGCGQREADVPRQPVAGANVSARGPLPASRPAGFVGSEACRECHAAICDLYATHPMGRSLGEVTQVESIEQCPSGEIDAGGSRRYRVECEDGEVWHHEYLTNDAGEVVYDQAEQVQYAVGSGQRGRAYLLKRNGLLHQSPLGWYSTGDRWDLSPGYSADAHQRFQRRIGDGCLYCHAGKVDSIGHDRYAESPFVEASIGCERCHGPGAAHIDFHHAASVTNLDPWVAESTVAGDPIVNPAKLDIASRESVCNQCHLQGRYTVPRYGRSFFDFRPGDRTEDIFVCLVDASGHDAANVSRVVSQVEQMRQSRCYVESQATLGCTSCHDPHAPVAPADRADFYRERCNRCHDDGGCSLPPDQQSAAPALGSCIHCHMPANEQTNVPHTAQTDHRIPRLINQPPSRAPARRSAVQTERTSPSGGSPLAVFGDAATIPHWEQQRAIGIALMSQAWSTKDLALAREAVVKLVPPRTIQDGVDAMLAALTPDIPALNELAAYFWLTGHPDHAGTVWSHVLELSAEDETALGGLVLVSGQGGDTADAVGYLDRLLAITPNDPQWLTQKAKLAWQRGDRQKAFEAAEHLLRVDPTLSEFRHWLAEAYRSSGAAESAKKHQSILDRLLETD